jgi:hypothetical protein
MLARAVLLLAVPFALAEAQTLASRVTAVGTGTVRLSFASQEGVCGNGRNNISVRRADGRMTRHGEFSGSSRDEWEDECEAGPVRLAVDVSRGQVTAMRSYVGGRWRGTADLDLGDVPALDAQTYLVEIARSGNSRSARNAIFPAMLANAPNPWRSLLGIARDDSRPRDVRNSAMFWVGQAAEEAATRGLIEVVEDEGDKEVRKSAVFSLSQRPKDESVPALIRIARSHRDPELRRTAIFWLGQSRDERAIRYFEEVLLGSR